MVTRSIILAWEIPWTEESGRLQSTGSQRVGHDFTNNNNNSCYRVWPRNGLGIPVTNGDTVPCSLMISKKKKKQDCGRGRGGKRVGRTSGNSARPTKETKI